MKISKNCLLAIGSIFMLIACHNPESQVTSQKQTAGNSCDDINNCDSDNICIDCGAHGKCNATIEGDGTCKCAEGWAGTLCNECDSSHFGTDCQECPICGEHGKCNSGLKNDGKCLCDEGFGGELCNDCMANHYGPACATCECGEHGHCEPGINSDGHCLCDEDFTGAHCAECSDSRFTGPNCDKCAPPNADTVNDIDCNNYPTVKINDLIWMAENLKTTTDRSGNPVNCYANTEKDPDFVKNYGCLYVWNELEQKVNGQDNNVNNICPEGWRLPTADEFTDLITALGGGSDSFNKLCAESWNNGNNSSGFGVLPAGIYDSNSSYSYFGLRAYFWSSTQIGDRVSALSVLAERGTSVSDNYKYYGFLVRCVKD